ncbi:MAG TPA: hypothetical protein VK699_08975 [Terriglobales bacterium]|jgi:hypothetical protein|nr:hypothetical protein [Terriglobales bacterium]
MATKIRFVLQAVSLFLCLIFCPIPGMAESCTNASLSGAFGFFARVFGYGNSGFVEVGRIDADGAGNFSEVVTTAENGNITRNVLRSGTYSINPDCSGVAHFNRDFFSSLVLVLLPDGNNIDIVSNRGPLGHIALGGMRRISHDCSSASLKGSFVSTEEGRSGPASLPPAIPTPDVAAIGAFVSDGAGNAVGTFTGNATFTQSYSVNSDCTGSSVTNFGFSSMPADFVIVGNGSAVYGVVTSPSNCGGCGPLIYVMSEKLKRTDEDGDSVPN